ncbi:MAG: Gfo/Idh/MocA family oxidoreductase [Bacteroidetes bacterium]|jgi:predicted dehydrogenase|nr:Gfo/Idh/MocA family oxidoreductase [Bacteroidota bacterium]MBT4408207.1 Gfo/Idh/MocA family oxidoreductase [Bacteroidota bacterium]MBT7464804.1 Gfo/Idh/MocA family oxidoreductase [Bacteroidota bacterium]
MKKTVSRRDFLTKTGVATAGVMVVPRHVLGGKGFTAPSDKLNIAAIGSGGMGGGNIGRVTSENIVALCDVDFARAAGTFKKFPKAKQYKDFRKMLDKEKSIDAVIVATPDHTHAVAAMAAIKRGQHVYVQKPMTHDVFEARKLTEAAREYNIASQMGNQGRSGEGTRRLAEWIWAGAIGDVKEVHSWTNRPVWPQGIDRPSDTVPVPDTLDWDLWLGTAPERPYNPTYLPFNWRAWYDFGAGALGDMGCHVLDPVFNAMKLKYPIWVQGSRSYDVQQMWKRFENNETYPRATMITYKFPAREGMPPVKLKWYDGGILPEWPAELDGAKIPMGGGSMFIGEKGVIICSTYGDDVQMFPEERFLEYKTLPKTLKRIETSHEMNWVEACKGGEPASSNFDYSGPLTEMVLMGNLAIRVPGERLLWDGENMTVTNNEDANKYIRREYRNGWEL